MTVIPAPGPEQSSLADACPACHPGDHDAVVPYDVTEAGDGLSLRAEYFHDACGAAWSCSWDAAAAGWAAGHRQAARLSYAAWLAAELACPDCTSQVLVTVGSDRYRPYRARVVHCGGCPWYARHLARVPGCYGAVPCAAQVTHRGPYKRPPDPPAAIPQPGPSEMPKEHREMIQDPYEDTTAAPETADGGQAAQEPQDGAGTEETGSARAAGDDGGTYSGDEDEDE